MTEAAAHLRNALEQLSKLPDGQDRQRQELELQTALGGVLGVVKGFPSPERGRTFDRARELWEALGSPPEFIGIPYGQAQYYVYRGEVSLALRTGYELLRVSRERNDATGVILGHSSLGRDQMIAGRFAESRSHLEEFFRLSDRVSRMDGDHPGRAQRNGTGFRYARDRDVLHGISRSGLGAGKRRDGGG